MAADPPDSFASDDFLEQILAIPTSYAHAHAPDVPNSSDSTSLNDSVSHLLPSAALLHPSSMFPLSLSLDTHRDGLNDNAGPFSVKPEREAVDNNIGSLYPAFDHLRAHAVRHPAPHLQQAFHGHPMPSTVATMPQQPPGIRPRVRARRGQATDPHSIAERLRRERISERIKALQELVPSCNKTDRAAMLDEILDYVKFLRLQVKVLSMSRLGGAGAVAQLVSDIPLQAIEDEGGEMGSKQHAWEKCSNEETEREVAKLMEEDVGAAMQFLQSKSLCIMPISLASLIYPTNQSEDSTLIKPEPSAPS